MLLQRHPDELIQFWKLVFTYYVPINDAEHIRSIKSESFFFFFIFYSPLHIDDCNAICEPAHVFFYANKMYKVCLCLYFDLKHVWLLVFNGIFSCFFF
jgi:hypothetical protein